MTPKEFEDSAVSLYREGKYAEALALIEHEEPNQPDMAWPIHYWKLCLLGIQNRTDEAVRTLQAALDRGLWYSPRTLRTDSDLASLQAVPEYVALVTLNEARQAEAQTKVTPKQIVIEPKQGTPPYPLLIVLHGNMSHADSMVPYWESAAAQGWLVAIPQSEQLAGMEGRHIWDDYEWSKQTVLKHFEALKAQHVIDPNRILIAGFSMGGQTAIRMALDNSIAVRGFIGVGAWMGVDPTLAYLKPYLEPAQARGLRGALVIGEKDAGSLPGILKLSELFKMVRIEHQLHVYPELEHTFPPDFESRLKDSLAFLLG